MPDYQGGFPNFAIEKPYKIPWRSNKLLRLQRSGEYEAELKIDEDRSFLCIDEDGNPEIWSHRKIKPQIRGKLLEHIRSLNIAPCTVIDGGVVFNKKLGNVTRFYAFDVLVYRGQRVRLPWSERRQLRDQILKTDELVWLPLKTDNFISEFQRLIQNNCDLVRQAADQYGIDYETFKPFVEGFVIKKKEGTLSFPHNKREVFTMYKVRLEDLIASQKEAWITGL